MSVVCVLVLLFASPTSLAVAAATRVLSVEPDYGKAGDELVAKGEKLGSNSVRKLYLTDGQNDFEVEIKEQKAEMIRFRIPAKIELGQYRLMVLTDGVSPTLLEQPVICSVLDEEGLRKKKAEEQESPKTTDEEAASEETPKTP